MLKKIAIIPLKSDSKRFLDKNFKFINSKPLLINTMDKLHEAGVDIIIISTDVRERVFHILSDCKYKSIFIFDRPDDLMGDAKTELVVLDTINKISELSLGLLEDYTIVLTQVTSPLWKSHRLVMAFDKIENKNIDSVISVSTDFVPDGSFYVFKKNMFLKHRKIYTRNQFLISIPYNESIDIDFEHELTIANALLRGNYV